MDVRVLGELEVRIGSSPVRLTAPRQRALIEMLAVHSGETVDTDRLVDALWGDRPPKTATRSLRSHVSRVRAVLPDGALATVGHGYRLGDCHTDVDLFVDLCLDAERARAAGEFREAADLIDDALVLWRGTPLTDLADGDVRRALTTWLDELHQSALELRVAVELELGHHREALPELERLVALEPRRERRWELLMLALHRSGRRIEALDAARRLEEFLRAELDVAPSASVLDLAARIEREDPSLEPPPRRPPCRLPVPATSFVGRTDGRAAIAVEMQAHRLVTLVGIGGIGKTRLAIEVARDLCDSFPGGVWFRDVSGTDDLDDLLDEWRSRAVAERTLLVIDAAEEHVAELAAALPPLLETAPALSVLTTSRIPIGCPGEHLYPVPPLEVGSPDGGAGRSEAAALFLQRRSEGEVLDHPEIEAVEQLCAVTDGIPLGIELLAGHSALRPSQLLGLLLEDPTQLFVASGRGDRQADLDRVVEETLRLLSPPAGDLLGRLAVMRSSFDVDAALAVAAEGGLAAFEELTDANLVTRAEAFAGPPRYRLLDTIRAHARSDVDDATHEEARRSHARHFRDVARQIAHALNRPNSPPAYRRATRDAANLHAALDWHLAHDPDGALAFGPAIALTFNLSDDLAATRALLTRLRAAASDEADPVDRAWLDLALVWPAGLTGGIEEAIQHAESAAAVFSAAGERRGEAEALAARGHLELLFGGDSARAISWYERAATVAEEVPNPATRATILLDTAQALIFADRIDESVDQLLDLGEEAATASGDEYELSHLAMNRMLVALTRDDLDGARRHARSALEWGRRAGVPTFEQTGQLGLGATALHAGDHDAAREHLLDALRTADTQNNEFQGALALRFLALLVATQGHYVDCARVWGATGTIVPAWSAFDALFTPLLAPARNALGSSFDVHVGEGAELDLDAARRLLEPYL